jgi:hypothetical protein
MPTFADAIDLFKTLAAADRHQLESFDQHLPGFNAAQRALWKILTTRKKMNNWFVVASQASTPANPDYFGPLAVSSREYPLPPNFHHLRLIECVTASYEHVRFTKEPIDSPLFKQGREYAVDSPFGSEAIYDIIGTGAGRMMLAQFPPAVLELKLWYCRHPTVLVARTDSLNDFPIEAPELLSQWVIMKFKVGADAVKWAEFVEQWRADVEQLVFGETRDDTAPTIVQGFMEN